METTTARQGDEGGMMAATLDRSGFPAGMIAQLASAMRKRYHTAMLDSMGEQEAFEEMIRIILETYREALAS